MIQVIVNGQRVDINDNTTLTELVASQAQSDCAVAVNQQFIPKGLYQQTQLQQGDQIELLVPMQGG